MQASRISQDIYRMIGDAEQGVASEHLRPLDSFVGEVEEMRNSDGDPLCAWCAGERVDPFAMGLVGRELALCRTFGHALRTLVEGFPLLQTMTDTTLAVREDTVSFSYRILDPGIWPRRGDAELTLAVVSGLSKAFGIPKEAMRGLEFEHVPDRDPKSFVSRFGCLPKHDAEANRILFHARALDATRDCGRRLKECEASTADGLKSSLNALRESRSVKERSMEVMLRNIAHGSVSQAYVSVELGMSTRSLRRSLAQEETTFQRVLDDVRRLQAIALLLNTDLPLGEIGLRLGYSDQSAFSRAFARCVGVSPMALRRGGGPANNTIC